MDEVTFSCKLSHKGKKAKWYMRNNVSIFFMHQCTIAFRNQKILLTPIVFSTEAIAMLAMTSQNMSFRITQNIYNFPLPFQNTILDHLTMRVVGPYCCSSNTVIFFRSCHAYCSFYLFQLSMHRNRRYIGKAIIPLLTFDDIDSIEFYPYIIYQGNPKISHCS